MSIELLALCATFVCCKGSDINLEDAWSRSQAKLEHGILIHTGRGGRGTLNNKRANSPSLVHVDYKNEVVAEAGDPVGGWHFDDEGKEVVDEGVESLDK